MVIHRAYEEHFSHSHLVVLDRMAISEMIQVLLSYQTINGMRVVIIVEELPAGSPLIQQLLQIGIFEIVTASEIEQLRDKLRECFSDDGMQRYKTTAVVEVANELQFPQLLPEQTKYSSLTPI